MNKKVFEFNTINNIDSNAYTNPKLKKTSPIVEIFSAIVEGQDTSKYGKKVDLTMERIKDLGKKAMGGNPLAKAELNTIQRYTLEPHLQNLIQLFNFMGTFKDIGYDVQPMVKTYKHESIRSNFQAIHGDVPFGVTTWKEYPISTQNISSGYAVDYREVAAGNLDKVSEGMEQVKVDMMNKAMLYVVFVLYDRIKNAKGVKYFAESEGINKDAVDDIIKKVRRFGKPTIMGDYAVVSQISESDFDIRPGITSEAALEEIRKTGLLSVYKGAPVVELPNSYNLTQLTEDGKNFKTYLPEGLMFIMPKGTVAPLQIFRRGGLTSMAGKHIETGNEVFRFDMEIAADLAKGREYEVGLISDSTFEAPSLD